MLKALERMGYKGQMTGHGFRGLASTILNEMGYERAHIEIQLAHAPQNEVEGAYNKAIYLPQRQVMMQGGRTSLTRPGTPARRVIPPRPAAMSGRRARRVYALSSPLLNLGLHPSNRAGSKPHGRRKAPLSDEWIEARF